LGGEGGRDQLWAMLRWCGGGAIAATTSGWELGGPIGGRAVGGAEEEEPGGDLEEVEGGDCCNIPASPGLAIVTSDSYLGS
jgi:hypothetical protein